MSAGGLLCRCELTMSVRRHVNPPLYVVVQTLCLLVPLSHGFYLQGSRTSYVRLPRWHSCSNSSLTLDFWTSLSDALLVYADDGGRSSFVLLSINHGLVMARINVHARDDLAAHTTISLNVQSRPVNDRQWHTVCLSVCLDIASSQLNAFSLSMLARYML